MKRNCKGNVTIEYALFLPIFVMVLMLIVFFGMQMVRTANMQRVADETADAMARIWMTDDTANLNELLKDGSYGTSSIMKRERYWWLNALLFTGGKLREAERIIIARLSKRMILQGGHSPAETGYDVQMQYHPIFGGGEISVVIEWKGSMLFENLLEQFGLAGISKVSVQSSAFVTDPRELINNTDFLLQTFQRTQIGNMLSVKLIEPIRNSITKFLQN